MSKERKLAVNGPAPLSRMQAALSRPTLPALISTLIYPRKVCKGTDINKDQLIS